MLIPKWADEALSHELPSLRVKGEGQALEFKVAFPDQARHLAREIAAFATSNDGKILLGVDDNGQLIGLENLDNPRRRDDLLQRIQGVCHHNVKPSVTVAVEFAFESARVVVVAVISVPKGTQPVYYYNGVPYLRHLTESRPAQPHEVIELIRVWLSSNRAGDGPVSAANRLLSRLASIIVNILILSEELEDRRNDHWQFELMNEFRVAADALHKLANTDTALGLGVTVELESLADAADQAGWHSHRMGRESWNIFAALVHATADRAARIKQERIDSLPMDKGALCSEPRK